MKSKLVVISFVQEEFGVKMHVIQESIDVDGIEHKPLKIMGDADRVEVGMDLMLLFVRKDFLKM